MRTTMDYKTTTLEIKFTDAYYHRYGKPVQDFRVLDNGFYMVNNMQISELELRGMLSNINQEIAAQKMSVVKRLIRFFDQRKH